MKGLYEGAQNYSNIMTKMVSVISITVPKGLIRILISLIMEITTRQSILGNLLKERKKMNLKNPSMKIRESKKDNYNLLWMNWIGCINHTHHIRFS